MEHHLPFKGTPCRVPRPIGERVADTSNKSKADLFFRRVSWSHASVACAVGLAVAAALDLCGNLAVSISQGQTTWVNKEPKGIKRSHAVAFAEASVLLLAQAKSHNLMLCIAKSSWVQVDGITSPSSLISLNCRAQGICAIFFRLCASAKTFLHLKQIQIHLSLLSIRKYVAIHIHNQTIG